MNFEPAVEELQLQLQVSTTLANGLNCGLQSFNDILQNKKKTKNRRIL
jgi:hypothetical protein